MKKGQPVQHTITGAVGVYEGLAGRGKIARKYALIRIGETLKELQVASLQPLQRAVPLSASDPCQLLRARKREGG